MLASNSEPCEITFKCRQHNKTAISFCRTKFCSERLLCVSCFHPHTDIEPVDSLFAFSSFLKRDTLLDDNTQFVNGFLLSLGDIFRSIKSTEESLLWLHQMLIAVSESSTQLKASIRSLQMLSLQLTNFLSQRRDSREATDSKQLSELIEWYLTLRTTVMSQIHFDVRDCEYINSLHREVNLISQTLCEKVLLLSQRFSIMKRGGTARPETSTSHPTQAVQLLGLPNMRNLQSNSVADGLKDIVKSEVKEDKPHAEEKKVEDKMVIETKADSSQNPPVQKSLREKRLQNREMNQVKISVPPKKDKLVSKAPKKPKVKEASSAKALNDKKEAAENDEPAELRRPFEVNQKEKIAVVERWLKHLENNPSDDQTIQEEAKQLKIEFEAAKELVNSAKIVTEKMEANPIKDLKRDLAQIFHDLLKSTDGKSSELYLEEIKRRIEKLRVELLEGFEQSLTEEEIRNLISKMKESRIDVKSEMSKLIEICLEYQLRWGKVQPEINAAYSKTHDFFTYQNIIERYCRLRLKTPNYEKVLNDYFRLKLSQIHLEYFFTCMQKTDLLSSLQVAYSNDTNEVEAQMIFGRLQAISLAKARETLLLAANPTEISLEVGEGYAELSGMIEQTEKLQNGLRAVLVAYEQNQDRENVLAEAAKSLQTKLFFEELMQLKRFNPKITLKNALQGTKAKKSTAYSRSEKDHYYDIEDDDDDSYDEFRDTRKNKKLHLEELPQLSITTRSSRMKPQSSE